MANEEQLALLKQGVEVWNKWREDNPEIEVDLHGADLRQADLRGADLRDAELSEAILIYSNLTGARLNEALLVEALLTEANLSNADLRQATLFSATLVTANMSGANLTGADLTRAVLIRTDLTGADLSGATLSGALLIGTKIDNANLSGSRVYGISVWDLEGAFKNQKDLVITRADRPVVTVDSLEVAQFIYLLLNNEKLRDVINTLTSKSVLILGRFALAERKAILDSLRDKLRQYNLLPIVFDFDRPTDKDFTETIKTLAGLCYFVIADVTNPKSSPLELQATVPDFQIPFVPIIEKGEEPFAMMANLQTKYDWVLDTVTYDSPDTLMKALKPAIIDRAIQKHNELRLAKARQPKILSASDFIDDKGLDNPTNVPE